MRVLSLVYPTFWLLSSLLWWWHRVVIAPICATAIELVFGVLEEICKSIIRESFAFGYRTVNGVSAFFISVFIDGSYYRKQRAVWSPQKPSAHDGHYGGMSTLNAFLERQTSGDNLMGSGATRSQNPQGRARNGSSSPAPPRVWRWWPQAQSAPNCMSHAKKVRRHAESRRTYRPSSPLDFSQGLFRTDTSLSAINSESGVFEDMRHGLELGLARLFRGCRLLARRICLIPTTPPVPSSNAATATALRGLRSRRSSISLATEEEREEVKKGGMQRSQSSMAIGVRRSRSRSNLQSSRTRSSSVGRFEDMGRQHNSLIITSADLIHKAGYPVEEHQIATSDGYMLLVDRIPRPGSRHTVFFVHGVFDTSLSWVCNGVTGSQAFAAWDAGFDVWLGTTRSNPPRLHLDPAFRGPSYWNYSVNEFGLQDMHAQIEHIHNVKCAELGSGTVKLVLPRRPLAPTNGINARSSVDAGGSASQTRTGFQGLLNSWRSRVGLSKSSASDTDLMNLVPPDALENSGSSTPCRDSIDTQPDAQGPNQPRLAEIRTSRKSPSSSSSNLPIISPACSSMATPVAGLSRHSSRAQLDSVDEAAEPDCSPRRGGPRCAPTSRWAIPGDEWEAGLEVRVTSDPPPPRQTSASDAASTNGVLREAPPDAPLPALGADRQNGSLVTGPSVQRDAAVLLPSLAHRSARDALTSDSVPSPASPLDWAPEATGKRCSRCNLLRHSSSAPRAAGQCCCPESSSHGSSGGAADSKRADLENSLPSLGASGPLQDISRRSNSGAEAETLPPAFQPPRQRDAALRASSAETASTPLSYAARFAVKPLPRQPSSRRGSVFTSGAIPAGGRQASGGAAGVDAGSWSAHSGRSDSASAATTDTGSGTLPFLRRSRSRRMGSLCEPESPPFAAAASQSRSAKGEAEPYRLVAVGHSLGGAALLMYAMSCLRAGRRHHLSRLVLLTPAGYVNSVPLVVRPVAFVLPHLLRFLRWLFPSFWSSGFYLPSSLLRSVLFKLTADLKTVPALSHLAKAWLKLMMNGDSSDWDRAMQMPHYNQHSMPAVSLLQAVQMLQWINTGRFQLYDYGSREANQAAYGQPTPPDIAEEYWRLDVPVDLAAGKFDGVISPACVKRHYFAMQAAGVTRLTYREFEFGHLDFTFAAKEELRHHVLDCIQRRD